MVLLWLTGKLRRLPADWLAVSEDRLNTDLALGVDGKLKRLQTTWIRLRSKTVEVWLQSVPARQLGCLPHCWQEQGNDNGCHFASKWV